MRNRKAISLFPSASIYEENDGWWATIEVEDRAELGLEEEGEEYGPYPSAKEAEKKIETLLKKRK